MFICQSDPRALSSGLNPPLAGVSKPTADLSVRVAVHLKVALASEVREIAFWVGGDEHEPAACPSAYV